MCCVRKCPNIFVISASLDDYTNASLSWRLKSRNGQEHGQEGKLEYCDRSRRVNKVFPGSRWITGSQTVCYLGTKGRRCCCCWSRNLFQRDFPAGEPTSVQMIFDHNRTAFHFSLRFLSVIQKNSHTKIPRHYIQWRNLSIFSNKKVLLHNWSCITLLFLALSVAISLQVVCF